MSNLLKINQVIKSGQWIKYAGKCTHSKNKDTPCKETCLYIAKGKQIEVNCAICNKDLLLCEVACKVPIDEPMITNGKEYYGYICSTCLLN